MLLNHILRKCTAGYTLSKSQEKINHLMYMDDIKLFAKNEIELKTLMPKVRIYSQDKGIEYGMEKCAVLVMLAAKDAGPTEWNYQIKTRLEHSQKRKHTNT